MGAQREVTATDPGAFVDAHLAVVCRSSPRDPGSLDVVGAIRHLLHKMLPSTDASGAPAGEKAKGPRCVKWMSGACMPSVDPS